MAPGEVGFGMREGEFKGFRCQIELNAQWGCMFQVCVCVCVIAAVKFELEMVACGFALPLLALCRHVPALIHQNTFFLLVPHDYCVIFVAHPAYCRTYTIACMHCQVEFWLLLIIAAKIRLN